MPMLGLFLVALGAGLVGALTGMGGSVVLLPVLTLSGVDIKHTIAVSILSSIVISGSAGSNYTKEHLTNLRIVAFLELFAVVGALIGAFMAVFADPCLLLVACGGGLVMTSLLLWNSQRIVPESSQEQDALCRQWRLQGSYYDRQQRRTIAYQAKRAAWGGAFTGLAGFVTGSLGVGGSAFVLLTEHAVMELPPKVAVTTSNLILSSMALAGASLYLEARLIDVHLAIPVIGGVFLGALAGSVWLRDFTNETLRRFFLGAVIIFGIEMVFRALGQKP